MNGEIPFQPEILNKIVDKHTSDTIHYQSLMIDSLEEKLEQGEADKLRQDLNDNINALKQYVNATAAKINENRQQYFISSLLCETAHNEFFRIDARFNTALNQVVAMEDTPQKKKLIEGMLELKKAALAGYQKEEPNFQFDDCMAIAENLVTLATKVSSNTVTEEDIKNFAQATHKYKQSHAVAIALAVIIGAAGAMLAGAAIGFAVSGVTGAIIGGAAGLVAGGIISGVSCSMWYNKNDSLNKVSSAASDLSQSMQI